MFMYSNFCGGCNRLRVTADGQLKVCLFGSDSLSIMQAMRGEHYHYCFKLQVVVATIVCVYASVLLL